MCIRDRYRTNHVLAENNYLLSSSRKVEIAKNLDMEEAVIRVCAFYGIEAGRLRCV